MVRCRAGGGAGGGCWGSMGGCVVRERRLTGALWAGCGFIGKGWAGTGRR